MRYTIKQFNEEFPTDDVCLETVFNNRYADINVCPNCGVTSPKFYRVTGRKCWACNDCGHQLHPLANTIFHKSATPLKDWFYAIYLFSVSKNGVSAKELERCIGVSYKTAHRMEKQIRKLMADDDEKLGGSGKTVQADETYIGGRAKQTEVMDNKTPVLAVLEVGGKVKTEVVDRAIAKTAIPFLHENVEIGSTIHTDESKIYTRVKYSYNHASIRHIAKVYAKDGVTTNHVEGFFSQLKRSLDGTYHAVSPKYLNGYVNEFSFRYNYRKELIFPILLKQAVKPF